MSDCQTVRAGVLMREISQLERDPLVATHLAVCPRCAADATMVRTATVATAEMLDSHAPFGDPGALTETLLTRAAAWRTRRTRAWRHASWALFTIAVVAWIIASSDRASPLRAAIGFPDAPYVTTITLRCLSGSDAASAAQPYLLSRGSEAVAGPATAPSITLRGLRSEVAQAEIAIATLDGRLGTPPAGACAR